MPTGHHLRSTLEGVNSSQTDNAYMNEIQQLQSMGLTLPTPAFLLGAVLFGLVGLVAFRRWKKASSSALKWPGLALMFYPYAVTDTLIMWVVGIALSGWVSLRWE